MVAQTAALLTCAEACHAAADATGRWAGKQFSIVAPKKGKAPDTYLDKEVRSNALVGAMGASVTPPAAECMPVDKLVLWVQPGAAMCCPLSCWVGLADMAWLMSEVLLSCAG